MDKGRLDDDGDGADEHCGGDESFYVNVRLLTGKSFVIDLSPSDARPGCRGAMTTVDTAKEHICAAEGLLPDMLRFIYAGQPLQDDRSLAHYRIRSGAQLHAVLRLCAKLFFPRAPVPDPASDVPATGDWSTVLCTSRGLPLKLRRRRSEIKGWVSERVEGVHVWRVDKDQDWVELVLEGPPGSFYEGGAFLLRVAFPDDYPFRPFSLRLLTPLYHPTVGPAGVVGVIGHDPLNGWNPAKTHRPVVVDFLTQLCSHELSPMTRTTLEAEIVQMSEVLADWTSDGEEGARVKARLWTWHFATPQGRAYLRSGHRCSGLAQLAGLAAVDRQVREEVRLTLLMANRYTAEDDAVAAGKLQLIGGLPRELLHAVLFHIASDRPPPPAALRWELLNDGDDGLPADWRARLPDLSAASES